MRALEEKEDALELPQTESPHGMSLFLLIMNLNHTVAKWGGGMAGQWR